jgi:HEPN domain-containing protein
MASPLEHAKLLLSKAQDDWAALKILLDNSQVADEIIGFHAQQIVEKALKAVLAIKSVPFRRTHDLAELIDILSDKGISVPIPMDKCVELTPFAVEYRYDFLPPENKGTNSIVRDEIRSLVLTVLEWSKKMVS